MTIRTILVDDESLAIQGLKLRLQAHEDVEIIETCTNGREAIRAIKTHKPDLVFLDIQMPGFDGFSVVQGMMEVEPPLFIFVTAYSDHAIRAFEAQAVDYLMKPVDEGRLADALDRVRLRLSEKKQVQEAEKLREVLAEVAPTPEAISVGVVDVETQTKALSLRVLTVDDSSVARKQVTRCLQTIGVEVVALNDGKQALDYLRKLVDEGKKPEEEFLMMISDIEMPEMDGYTLTAEIRGDARMQKLHIILHTSLSGVFNQAMVKKVGADDFLAKFRPDDLASRVVDRIKAADIS